MTACTFSLHLTRYTFRQEFGQYKLLLAWISSTLYRTFGILPER
jgi:hypothetical protein